MNIQASLNLWDTMKMMLEGKFIALSAFIKKLERSHTTNLAAHLNALEEKEVIIPKRSRWPKIIKLMSETNEIETKRKIRESMKQRFGTLRKLASRQTLIQSN